MWVRLLFVALSLVGGLGVVLYVALWLGLIGARRTGMIGRLVAVAVAILGCAWVVGGGMLDVLSLGALTERPVVAVVALVGVALSLWHPPSPTTPTVGMASSSPAVTGEPPEPPPPPRPRREPSPLGRIVLAVALLIAATGALVDRANGGRLHPEQWLGAAALVCGLGLVVGAFAGRARWLVVPAVLFAGTGLAWGMTARVGASLTEWGGRWIYVHEDGVDGPHVVRNAAGSIDVIVAGHPVDGARLDLTTAFGDVHVRVAQSETVAIDAVVDHGSTTVQAPAAASGRQIVIGSGTQPDVTIRVRIGVGHLTLERFEQVEYSPATTTSAEPFGATTTVVPMTPSSSTALTSIAPGVAMQPDGTTVLDDGEAVIGPYGEVLVGSWTGVGDGIQISTASGTYRLLPDRTLLTPTGSWLDLAATQAALPTLASAAVPSNPGTTTTVPASPVTTAATTMAAPTAATTTVVG